MDSLTTTTIDKSSPRQQNSAAIMSANFIWAAGCQSIMHSMAMTAHRQAEQSWTNWRSLASAKSPQEALQMQLGLLRTTFEHSLAESARLTKESIQLVEKAAAPINACMKRSVAAPFTLGD